MPQNESSDRALSALDENPSRKLGIFIDGKAIETAQHIGKAAAQKEPQIAFAVPDSKAKYIVVSLDLDAPYSSFAVMSPILHWIQPGLVADAGGNLAVSEPFIADYIGPAPPPGSGPHRYTFYLFKQPASFDGQKYSPAGGAKMGLWPRLRFSLDSWMSEVGADEPLAANYFLSISCCSYDLFVTTLKSLRRHYSCPIAQTSHSHKCRAMRHQIPLSNLISSVLSAAVIVQFPNGTWLENLAVRPSGGILMTELNPQPVLLHVDPFISPASVQEVYSFPPPATALTGIAELGEDIFYVVSLAFDVATSNLTAGSGQLWLVDMTQFPESNATVSQVANLTDIAFPNGATWLPGSSSILIADYVAGKVFGVDVDTGTSWVAVDDPAVSVPPGATVGVNGVHAPGDGFLYFTNSGSQSYGRVPIDSTTGSCVGEAQILFQNSTVSPDDFAIVEFGCGYPAAYLADKSGNRIVMVDGSGDGYEVVADVAGPTSVVLTGQGLYVSSTGGDDDYSQDPIPVGGALSYVCL